MCIFQSPKKSRDIWRHRRKVYTHQRTDLRSNMIQFPNSYKPPTKLELMSIYKQKDEQHLENAHCLWDSPVFILEVSFGI